MQVAWQEIVETVFTAALSFAQGSRHAACMEIFYKNQALIEDSGLQITEPFISAPSIS